MSTIKTQYEEIYTILEDNKNKKVSTILPQLVELMSRKNGASGQVKNFIKDEDGNTIAIFCYYHKRWELLSECEYGAKKNTATGYNTMCKEGVSAWTKQQRVKKQAQEQLLTKVSDGEVPVEHIGAEQQAIIEASKEIIPRADEHGYETVELALETQ